jgi:hypothetical protein
MKFLSILFFSLFLASCFWGKTQEVEKIVSEESVESIELSIPAHEKTTEIEAEFSQDLLDLLKLIDETPHEK